MAYTFYIEPTVNCVFVRHIDLFQIDEPVTQLHELISHPEFRANINILRDVLETSLPAEYNYNYFSEVTPAEYKDIDPKLGKCKVAWALGSGKDYAAIISQCQAPNYFTF